MSYILDSIKKAERERKLGQEAPTISIEYAGDHVNFKDGANWLQWGWLLFGMLFVSILIWGATNYFANKDRLYVQQLNGSEELVVASVSVVNKDHVFEKKNIGIVPVDKVHQSDLKNVKVITQEERVYQPVVSSVQLENNKTQSIAAERHTPQPKALVQQKQTKVEASKPKSLFQQKPLVLKQQNTVAAKQDLVEIYSDLAKSAPAKKVESVNSQQQKLSDQPDLTDQLIELEPANYVALDDVSVRKQETHQKLAKVNKDQVANKVPHAAAVNTGLPSFGELPYDVQEQIPEFNVSVHMFHADPIQRRIRMNGRMFTEGKQVQQGLDLVEITRYGAVLDFQGHLFRINVR